MIIGYNDIIINKMLILSLSLSVLRKKTFDKNDEKKAMRTNTINNLKFKLLYPSKISLDLKNNT